MADFKRGSHSARHRAGQARIEGVGPAVAGATDTALAESGLAFATSAGTAERLGDQPAPAPAPAPAPTREQRPHGRGAGAPRKIGRSMGLAIKVFSLLCALAVVAVAAMISVGPTGAPVATSVRTFLYDWETGDYAGAAALTTGDPAAVGRALRAAFRQLGAEDLVLSMGPIAVRRNTAMASFLATIDLGRGGLPWQYHGRFKLRRAGAGWLVVWSPSVIVPGLGVGDRLAVITTMPGRAPLLDATGRPLIRLSRVYEVGVVPDDVEHPAATAAELAQAAHLVASDADQIRGLIEAWPPHEFLGLIQLSPASYQRLRGELHEIGGVQVVLTRKRLFDSTVPDLTGDIGTETSAVIAKEGEPYRPGATIGESGLEQEYQAQLAGTPTTEVVVQNAAGRRVLHRWAGQAGGPVRTTIDGGIQAAAKRALAGLPGSGAIVAIRAGGGQILAVASRRAAGMPAADPLGGQYQPAQTFTIMTTAALLSWAPGFAINDTVPCKSTNPVGGQTFANVPPMKLGQSTPFNTDFVHACNTAFAGLSLRLSPSALTAAAKGFGIGGAAWRLPLPRPAFQGILAWPGNPADLAAAAIGTGSVRVSPLTMALAAGVIKSGAWLPPSLVGSPSAKPEARTAFGRRVISQIQSLMRATVRSGAARAANRAGAAIYGQVGTAPLPGSGSLSVDWFVGFRGNVAFAVVVFSRSASFDQAASVAGQFAALLPAGSFGR